MSLKTWMEEYYPITADEAATHGTVAACEHSLQKWIGLLPKNRRKHKIFHSGTIIYDDDEDALKINGDSCALCSISDSPAGIDEDCVGCPLFEVRIGVPCMRVKNSERISPYHRFARDRIDDGGTGDPRSMIRWLQRALLWARDAATNREEAEC